MNLHNSNRLTATTYGNCQAICFKITFLKFSQTRIEIKVCFYTVPV